VRDVSVRVGEKVYVRESVCESERASETATERGSEGDPFDENMLSG
jgi:hypothetical protein